MQCFKIYFDDIEGRIDPYYFCQDFLSIERAFRNIKFPILPLGELLSKNIINGYDNRNFIKKGIPYLRVSNIRPNVIDISSIKFIPSSKISKDIKLKEGDILLTRKGSYGISATVSKELENYIISSEIFRIVIKKDIIKYKYLSYWFNSYMSQKYFERIKSGAIMGHISQKALKSFRIPVPPKPIQQKIVDIMESAYFEKKQKEEEAEKLLDSIDDYILSELGIELPEVEDKKCFSVRVDDLEGRLDPYYYQAKFIFKYLAIQSSPYKKLSLGETITDLKNGIEIRKYSGKGFRYMRVSDLSAYGITDCNVRFVSTTAIPDKIKLNKNDFLISRSGSLGLVSRVTKDIINTILSSHIFKLSLNQKFVTPLFLETYLRSTLGQFQFFHKSNGGIVPEISQMALKSILVIIPPLETQNKIANEAQSRSEKAKQLRAEAEEILKNAQVEVEKIILGK